MKKSQKPGWLFASTIVFFLLLAVWQPAQIFAVEEDPGQTQPSISEEVQPVDLSDTSLVSVQLDKTKLIYTGKAQKPSVTVTLKKESKTLVKDTDYKVKYSTNKNIGTGKVVVSGIGDYTGTVSKTFKIYPAQTTGLKVVSQTTGAIKLSWNTVKKASYYQIFIYDGSAKKWVRAKTVARDNASVKKYTSGGKTIKLTAATAYQFKVRVYTKSNSGTEEVKTYYGDFSSVKKTGTTPKKVTGVKGSWSGSKSISLSWKALEQGSGYQIRYSTDQNFKKSVKSVLLSGKSKNSKTLSGLDSEQACYFKIRAYKTINGKKLYGEYSAVAAVYPKATWKQVGQRFYCYLSGSTTAKGLQEIEGKSYYFDSTGAQRTGWQKINGNYYFFQIANGKNGYMVKDKKVNGVTLQKDGKAVLTNDSRSKLNVLLKANAIVERVTEPAMTKSQKLNKCFYYELYNFRYRGSPTFRNTANWDREYALDMFDRGHGACYAYGASFAYLANAIGCTNVRVVSSGGHGWAEVEGKIYDISWQLADRRHNYFAMDPSLSGVDGRPNYVRNRVYIKYI